MMAPDRLFRPLQVSARDNVLGDQTEVRRNRLGHLAAPRRDDVGIACELVHCPPRNDLPGPVRVPFPTEMPSDFARIMTVPYSRACVHESFAHITTASVCGPSYFTRDGGSSCQLSAAAGVTP